MTFENPKLLWLLLLLPLFGWGFWKLFTYRRKILSELVSSENQNSMMIPRSFWIYWSKSAALLVGWGSLVIALAMPQGAGYYPTASMVQREVSRGRLVVAIDASASMEVADLRPGLSRLKITKEIVEGLLERIPGQRTSLLAFTSVVTPLSPWTDDTLFVRWSADSIQVNEGGVAGTDFEALFGFFQKNLASVKPTLTLLFTDGGDTSLETMQKNGREEALETLARKAKEAGTHLIIIGMGRTSPSPIPNVRFEGKEVTSSLDEMTLQHLATLSGGEYLAARSYTQLDLVDLLEKKVTAWNLKEEETHEVTLAPPLLYTRLFPFPLFVTLLALLFVLFVPETGRKK